LSEKRVQLIAKYRGTPWIKNLFLHVGLGTLGCHAGKTKSFKNSSVKTKVVLRPMDEHQGEM